MRTRWSVPIILIGLVLILGWAGLSNEPIAASPPAGGLSSPATAETGRPGGPPFAPGRLIVKFRDGVQPTVGKLALRGRAHSPLDDLLIAQQVRSVERLFRVDANRTGLDRIYLLRLEADGDVLQAAAALAADPRVEWAEPDYLARPVDTTPNDPHFSEQWGLTQIEAPAAWDVVTGTQTVVIAIVDSGIQEDHPDLDDHLWVNPGEIAGNGVDDDNNGYVDDVHGWNFVADSNDIADGNGHGTQVAGVAAAESDNGLGIAGVCWNCRIMPVKVMADSGVANYSDIAEGVRYAADKGAQVINLSLGGYANSNALREAVAYAADKGAVVVGGAGNDNTASPFYPAAYDGVLAVAGTADDDTKAAFSDYGDWVDLAAPAVAITTTFLGGDYGPADGTSLAAPFVSGLAGLIRSRWPEWTPAMVRNQLVQTADDLDALNPAYAGQLGAGRINAAAAMQDPHPVLTLAGTAVNGDPLGRPTPGEAATLVVTLGNDWLDAIGVTGVLSTTDPYVTLGQATASYGDIPAGESGDSSPAYTFTVASGAGYNHPIPFTLDVTANGGTYTTTLPFTITTRSGDEPFCGTIATDTLWTSDKTYIINCNVGVAPGYTLTIEPGTEIHFNGNYTLSVGGTLIADGTAAQPIRFMPHTEGGSWGRIFFDDPGVDAQTTVSGTYLSGNILRYVRIEGATGGIGCQNDTPYLDHVTLTGGGMECAAGDTPLWVQDSDLDGDVSATGGSGVNLQRSTVRGALHLPDGSRMLTATVTGVLTAGAHSLIQHNDLGSFVIAGYDAVVRDNTIGGGLYMGNDAVAQDNTIRGEIYAGSDATVQDNTVRNGGISAGVGAIVEENDIENAPDWGIVVSYGAATVRYNRLVGCASGIRGSGTFQGNLVADTDGIGLELLDSSTVADNTFTDIGGSTVKISAGSTVTITGNNFEFNGGSYDVENRVPKSTMATVNATGNWWGTTSNAIIRQRIYDFSDDYNLGQVLYSPVLTEPSTLAPAYLRVITLTPESPVGIQTVEFELLFSRDMDPEVAPQLAFRSTSLPRWDARRDMPTARDLLAAATGSDGRIYAIGGYNGGTLTTVEAYDPATDHWEAVAPMPTARERLAAATSPDGRIYAIGGYNSYGSNLATVEAYDPANDTWETVAPMPTARYGLAAATGPDGRIYAIGGRNSNGDYLATVEAYDPARDTWETVAPMPTARYRLAAVTGPDGRIYAIGGYNDSNRRATVEAYDPVHDTWETLSHMPTARYGLAAAVGPDGRIYAIGGYYTSTLTTLTTVDAYDPATDHWEAVAPMPTARGDLAAVAGPDGRIYAIGGYNDGSRLAAVEALTPPTLYTDFYSGAWPAPNRYRVFYDFSTLVPRDTYTLTVAGARVPETVLSGTTAIPLPGGGMAMPPNEAYTFTVDYAGYINDTTAPPAPAVEACAATTPDTISAQWSAYDPESNIDRYQYAIGLAPGGSEVVNWTFTTLTATTRVSLSLVAGQTYYVSVKARNVGGIWSTAASVGVVAGSGDCASGGGAACAIPLNGVSIDGPTTGYTDTAYTFAALISPANATTPITYTWSPEPQGGQGTENATYTWATPGTHTITVTVENCGGTVTATHTITIAAPPCPHPLEGVSISGPTTGYTDTAYSFTALISPANATTPITYTWSPSPQSGQGTAAVTYTWTTTGTHTITATVENCGGTVTATHTIAIAAPPPGCPHPLEGVSISGPTTGYTDTAHGFVATIFPLNATAPITYTWAPEPQGGQGTANVTYTWTTTGTHTLTVTAMNCGGVATATHTIVLAQKHALYLPLVLRGQ